MLRRKYYFSKRKMLAIYQALLYNEVVVFTEEYGKGERKMGWLFAAISVLAGTTKGYCGKRTSGYVNEYREATLANCIRMMLCVLIGMGVVMLTEGASAFKVDSVTLWIAVLNAVSNSAYVVFWLITVKKGAYMLLDVFQTIGLFIPTIGSALLFGEAIQLNHILGFAVLIAAAGIMCSYNNGIKSKITPKSFLLLIMCGISCGALDFSQKLFVELSPNVSKAVFNFYTYMFSAVILLVCFYVFSATAKEKKPVNIKPIFGYIIIMAICLFACSYFKTLAAEYLTATELYPVVQGASLTLSALMAAVFFRERLNIKAVVGIVLTFAALLIINML